MYTPHTYVGVCRRFWCTGWLGCLICLPEHVLLDVMLPHKRTFKAPDTAQAVAASAQCLSFSCCCACVDLPLFALPFSCCQSCCAGGSRGERMGLAWFVVHVSCCVGCASCCWTPAFLCLYIWC